MKDLSNAQGMTQSGAHEGGVSTLVQQQAFAPQEETPNLLAYHGPRYSKLLARTSQNSLTIDHGNLDASEKGDEHGAWLTHRGAYRKEHDGGNTGNGGPEAMGRAPPADALVSKDPGRHLSGEACTC